MEPVLMGEKVLVLLKLRPRVPPPGLPLLPAAPVRRASAGPFDVSDFAKEPLSR